MKNRGHPMKLVLRRYGLLVSGLSLSLAACGKDDVGPPDEEPCAHCEEGPFALPEGGEIRVESIEFLNDGEVTRRMAAGAVVFHDQEPARRALGVAIEGTACFDYRDDLNVINGVSDTQQAMADSRSYFDLGGELRLQRDGGEPIVLAKEVNVPDDALISGLQHDTIYKSTAIDQLAYSEFYRVEIDGTSTYPAFDLRQGLSWMLEDVSAREPTVYVPPDFELVVPKDDEFFAGTVIRAGEDFVFELDPLLDVDPDASTVAFLLGIQAKDRSMDFYCYQTPDDAAANRIRIPPVVTTAIEPEGALVFARFSHNEWNQGNRAPASLAFVGVTCKTGPYTLE
jgi:hypothetical protein